MLKRIFIPILLLLHSIGFAQQISYYENWFDTDYVEKIGVNVTTVKEFSFNGNIISPSISPGMHVWHIRFQQTDSLWSSVKSQYVIVSPSPQGGIKKMVVSYQCWLDTNFSNNIITNIAPTGTFDTLAVMPIPPATPGLHAFHFRALDNAGFYSSVKSQYILVSPSPQQGTSTMIVAYQCWLDTNYTNNITTNVTPATTIYIPSVSLPATAPGLHSFHFRSIDNNGFYSSIISQLVQVWADTSTTDTMKITGYEYWFDSNYSGVQSVTINSQLHYALLSDLNASSLSAGVHSIQMRFRQSNGMYSSVISSRFYKVGNALVLPNEINEYRYWFDSVANNITTVILPTPSATYDLLQNVYTYGLSAGKHTVHFQFKDLGDQWSSVTNDTFTNTVVIDPQAAFTAGDTVLCMAGLVTFTNTTVDANSYLWNFGDGTTDTSANPTHTYSTPGQFTVTLIAKANGVSDTLVKPDYIRVDLPPVITIAGKNNICKGNSDTLVASGAQSYIWYPSAGLNVTISSTVVATPSATNTYYVIGTDQYGCSDTSHIAVAVNNMAAVSISIHDTTVCQGNSVMLLTSGTGGYYWFPAMGLSDSTGSSVVVTPADTTTYYVVAPSSCGNDTATATINVNSNPVVSAGNDTAVCSGALIILHASGGEAYQWNNGINTLSDTIYTDTTAIYSVTVTNSSNCSATSTVIVTVHPHPAVNLPDTTVCVGPLILDAGNPGDTYLWYDSSTSETKSVSASGNYAVTVTNNFGCSIVDTAHITFSDTLPVNLHDTAICHGQILLLNAGYTNVTYLWSDSSTLQTLTVSSTGIYSVTITTPGGCKGTGSARVTVNPLPIVTISNDTTICSGDSVLLFATGGTSYLWSNGDSTAYDNILLLNTGGYYVTVTNSFGCTATDSVRVTVNTSPIVKLPESGVCPGSFLVLNAGNSGATFNWSQGSSVDSIVVDTPGTYSVTVTNVFGCSATGSSNVVAYPAPDVTISNDTSVCSGDSVLLVAGGGASYLWGDRDTLANNAILPLATGSYYVTVTDSFGCKATGSVNVIVNQLPVVSLDTFSNVCTTAAPFALMGGSPLGGTYSGNGVSNSDFNPQTAGEGIDTITYTLTDSAGCTGYATSTIKVNVCTGIDEVAGFKISILPNPTNAFVQIIIAGGNVANFGLQITDELGKQIHLESNLISKYYTSRFDLRQLAAGIYYFNISLGLEQKAFRIVLVK